MKNKEQKFIYFGTDDFSLKVLEKLIEVDFIPEIIVTAPDRPAGRGQKIQEPIIKSWVKENKPEIKILQPEKLDSEFITEISNQTWNFFVTASYGRIIPKEVIDIPEKGSFNVHPSLLPLYRGASPIESAILDDRKETGVSIMLMDEKMDYGSILNQEFVYFETWPSKIEVENQLAEIGGQLLSETINPYLNEEIEEQEQDHATATFTKKITKEIGEINLKDINNKKKQREIFLKVTALNPWPGVFFFIKKDDRDMRIKIKTAEWITQPDNSEEGFGRLEIKTVLPEGKQEIPFEDFKRGYLK